MTDTLQCIKCEAGDQYKNGLCVDCHEAEHPPMILCPGCNNRTKHYKHGLCVRCSERKEHEVKLAKLSAEQMFKPKYVAPLSLSKPIGRPRLYKGVMCIDCKKREAVTKKRCRLCYDAKWHREHSNPKKRATQYKAKKKRTAKKTKPEAIPMPEKKAQKKVQDAEISGVMGELFDDFEDLKDRIEKLKTKYFGE